jgi:hypothetical protein
LAKDVLAALLDSDQPVLAGALKIVGKMKEDDATVATAVVPRDWTEERNAIRDGFRELGPLASIDPTARLDTAVPTHERAQLLKTHLGELHMGLPLYILYVWDSVSEVSYDWSHFTYIY